MKRKIIEINESLCDGCGNCVPNCAEGAIQMIDGKARLISDLFCDGLGACLGECPRGAITLIEREAAPYDERLVMERIAAAGANTIKAHLDHLKAHGEHEYHRIAVEYLREKGIPLPEEAASAPAEAKPAGGGCPGMMAKLLKPNPPKPVAPAAPAAPVPPAASAAPAGEGKMPCGCPGTLAKLLKANPQKSSAAPAPAGEIPSALRQWPVQLHLLNPNAAYFDDAELLVAADCVAYAAGGFHRDMLDGKILAIFCPKLDHSSEQYVEKLAEIFRLHDIRSITVARMIVPCCGGTVSIVEEALKRSGKEIPLTVRIIDLNGEPTTRTTPF